MAAQTVYHQGWKLEDVSWDAFQPALVDSTLLAAIKAAALVEYNAPDYVTYLKRVFRNSGTDTLEWIETWGAEESQHGRALGRWAETADPHFKLEEAFARFREGLQPRTFHRPGCQRLCARFPPGRDGRPLCGRKRHLVLLLRHPGLSPTSRS